MPGRSTRETWLSLLALPDVVLPGPTRMTTCYASYVVVRVVPRLTLWGEVWGCFVVGGGVCVVGPHLKNRPDWERRRQTRQASQGRVGPGFARADRVGQQKSTVTTVTLYSQLTTYLLTVIC